MNWQTEEVQNWLKESAILYKGHTASQIQNLVEGWFLETYSGSATNHLKRIITLSFLDKVEWEKLVILPKTQEEVERDSKEYRKKYKKDVI